MQKKKRHVEGESGEGAGGEEMRKIKQIERNKEERQVKKGQR